MEGGIHPVLEQNYWQERRDSRLIPLRSCPNDRVHLRLYLRTTPGFLFLMSGPSTESNLF